jgi:hypothetical protein
MGWFRTKEEQSQPVNYEKDKNGNHWYTLQLNGLTIRIPTELTDSNGYELAQTVAEIFTPIDLIASKLQKLSNDIYFVDMQGNEQPMPNQIRAILDKPNPFYSIQDIAYNFAFSLVSDGNSILYTRSTGKKVTMDNITGLFLLEPDKTTIQLKSGRPKILDTIDVTDLVESYKYTIDSKEIDPKYITHTRYSMLKRSDNDFMWCRSPLVAAKQNIDNILAAYSARYNIFVNNGSAVIIAPKQGAGSGLEDSGSLAPNQRDRIVDDINSRNGLVGNKSVKTISSIPIEVHNTLATIKDLQPLEECLADMYMIGGILEIDRDLLPSKDGTTFTNKEVAEAKLWSDVAIPMANDFAQVLTSALKVKDGRLMLRTNNVGFLQSNRKAELEGDKIEIENMIAIEAMADGEFKKQMVKKYGKEGV